MAEEEGKQAEKESLAQAYSDASDGLILNTLVTLVKVLPLGIPPVWQKAFVGLPPKNVAEAFIEYSGELQRVITKPFLYQRRWCQGNQRRIF